ncbi:MAG: hypothetical protein WCQ95_10475 [Bacteroidota bacterium]
MKKNSRKLIDSFTKCFFGLFVFSLFSITGFSQNVGISATGATPPNVDAGLDINYTTKGVLIPRISLSSTSSASPLSAHIAGMIVYNTAVGGDVTPGFYYNDGTKWVSGMPKAAASGEMQYWNGTAWVAIPIGQPGQLLHINASGVPSWAP